MGQFYTIGIGLLSAIGIGLVAVAGGDAVTDLS
jgi:hypothetical protein